NPSAPRPVAMNVCPVPGRWFSRGTSNTTTPRFFAGSPTAPVAPTPHARPICRATSAAERSPVLARVTTAISPRVFSLTSVITAVMCTTEAASSTRAKSFTDPCDRGQPAREVAYAVPEGEIALNVTNHNYLDVVIYVVHDGVQTRVGMVTGSSSTVFFLPPRLVGQAREIQLLGDPIGSTDYARTD